MAIRVGTLYSLLNNTMEALQRSLELPLHYAAINRDITALQTVDAEFLNKEFADNTPLVLAVSDPNSSSSTFLHPLEIYKPTFPHRAATLSATVALLERGVNVNYSDSSGKTPLLTADESDAGLEIIQALVKHGVHVQHRDRVGCTAYTMLM
ncbi:hypothetical protein CAPTEDRAFT_202360 [Capitella teleta]|uniref:Uncharacterized protein n=1 Tax=Capitella teleta TaxID=283909 RepID=R7UWP7_CAPTE|nr:hypothetical protein CAPTEDRAFT_202360 [Capitella teleta]|eukprot:ELU11038.1 hypothetical protein CAPTEDRAFT_202360 [Capitella teleta]